MRILITGASGSGTSTLAAALANHLSHHTYLDGDHYYWLKPEPPFIAKRSPYARLKKLSEDIARVSNFVLAGSVDGWGATVENTFDIIVFLYLPTEIRIDRLRKRELQRFGTVDPAFLKWAAQYDTGTEEGRSLAKQRQWLAARNCPVLSLEGDLSVAARLTQTIDYINISLQERLNEHENNP